MTEVEMSRLMSTLTDTAKILNAESDSLNETIEAYEARLKALNLGLDVWGPAIVERAWTEDDVQGVTETQLGWRHGLGLCVRDVVSVREGDDWRVTETITPERLRETPREWRIAALKRLPELIREIQRVADDAVKTIRQARQSVK